MEGIEDARRLALQAYASETELDHPLEVAELAETAGAGQDVIVAAVLHDLIEDTDADLGQIAARFGSRVAALVSTMTEDESIGDYAERKAEHRERAAAAGRDVALLFVADKVSNARRMRRGLKKASKRKVRHYEATLETMRAAYPDLPLLDALERELSALRAERARSLAP